LIVQLDQGEAEKSASKLYALDGPSGRVIWQRSRAVPASWATPIAIEAAGKAQIVTLGVPWVIAYSMKDGTELWRAEGLSNEVTPSPVFAGGLVYAVSPNEKLFALRPDGQGDVTKTHVAWSAEDGIPDISSPVSNGELTFVVTTGGTVTCYDAKDGKKQWEQDLSLETQASPSIVGNRLYVSGATGLTVVLEASRQFKELARSDLGEKVVATPAFAHSRIFVCGANHLFCIAADSAKLARRD
jgi:outer membrane protein assembly factor BamB